MAERKLFLSYHFASDQRLAKSALQLAEAFDYTVVTGEDLGGGALTPEVMKRIEACDALVALMSRGPKKLGKKGKFLPYPWVLGELAHARARGLRNIALVADGVEIEGPYTDNERIVLDPRAPAAALVKLARTVSDWRRDAGRTLKVIILPEELAAKLRGDDVRCQYRFRNEDWIGPWQEAFVHPEIGGTCAYLKGVKDPYFIELRVRFGNETWASLSAPQWVRVELQKGAA
ncbi:MAG: hypothetical protein E6J90_09625 [Deltaproteobacteria bacterium]|nr:MAG: hypothetical protein E6J91_51425 [Deltaproteobacteria bacterium]TMQ23818.1 MAG: hypothetical protein E6J90_09625 [Deltaproteobacteria bacterium]